jgi:nucleoid DNA-binding protein
MMSIKKLVLDMIHAEAEKIAEGKSIKPASKAQVAVIYQATWTVLRKVIIEHGGYRIAGFGTFGRQPRAARPGRHWPTGESMEVPEIEIVRFSPTDEFKRFFRNKRKLK